MPVLPIADIDDDELLQRILSKFPRLMLIDIMNEMDRKRFGSCILDVKHAKVDGMKYTVSTRKDDYEDR